ncbi:MAG: hypothetical protein QM708_13205 [Propioniciclava sp.]|uniref:hypothetical protein n=1 Tax=Propioniciclava sp. TaxID=2038686 RepID=UPI0039E264EC
MSTTTLVRATEAASKRIVGRDRAGNIAVALMPLVLVGAVYGAVTSSAVVLLSTGLVATAMALAVALFSPVVPTSGR